MIYHKQSRFYKVKKYFLLIFMVSVEPVFSQAEFTIIGIPDTQYYTENWGNPGSSQGSGSISTFYAQTNWIVNNRMDSNIVYAAHLGDCVQNGDQIEQEWMRADTAMAIIENSLTTGLTDGIPYGIAVGNHDMTPWDNDNGNSTTIFYNQYFGISRFSERNYYAGHYGSNNDNHYDLFQVGLLKFIVIYIKYGEYRENPEVLDWADNLLSTYNDRLGIIVSHKLLDNLSGTQTTFSTAGEAIFGTLKGNSNLFLMLCGHWTNEGRRTDTNDGGNPVYTIMSDYQGLSNGGDGWFRIMRFVPLDNKIYVYTYSPTRDEFKTGENSQFALTYDFQSLLPVELSSFIAVAEKDRVLLQWRTETEVNNHGFELERSMDGNYWDKITFVQGHGNSNSPQNYSFTDNYPPFGKIYYRLKQVDNDGKFEYSNIINVNLNSATDLVLSQNYPNPFNPTTLIEYSLPKNSQVSLKIYDIIGREVATLKNEFQNAGKHSVTFNGSDLASGIYFYVLTADNLIASKKMSILK